jgi:uncharacterized membrane protein SirB2
MNPFVVVLIGLLIIAVALLVFEALRSLGGISSREWRRELRLAPRQKTMLLLSLLWTFVYVVFLFFWLPQNTFYRLFYQPALILLGGLSLSSIKRRTSKPRALAAFVVAVALANFLFLIYPYSHVEKYPPLAFALELNREWPSGTVVYYGAKNSDESLVRYFTPATRWKPLHPETLAYELTDIHARGATAWLETTAIDQLNSTPEGSHWLQTHSRPESLKQLNDSAYKIRFIQIVP